MRTKIIVVSIFIIFLTTLIIGKSIVDDINKNKKPEYSEELVLTPNTDDIAQGDVEPYFDILPTVHKPIKGGLDKYLNALRLNQSGLGDFDSVLYELKVLLETYGMSQPLRERGMYSIFDVGDQSRFQIVTQRNADSTDGAIVLVDLMEPLPYKSTLLYRGDFSHVEINRDTKDIEVYLRDESCEIISWGDIGVD